MLQEWLTPLDLYCERTGPDMWAEPLNAITNLSFVAAGLWGLLAMRRRADDSFCLLLCWWVIAIGIGSGLFHTFANRLTAWADILPIAGFTFAYTLFTLRRFMNLGWAATGTAFVLFYAAAGLVSSLVPDWMRELSNNSTGYLPPFLALLFFGVLLAVRGHRAGWYNLGAAAIFCLSVTFRALDPTVCDALPVGTHFLWHLLNGVVLGLLLASVVRLGPANKKAGA